MKKTTKGISCVALDRIERIKAVKRAEEEEEEEENGPLSTPARLVVQPVGSQDVVLVTDLAVYGICCTNDSSRRCYSCHYQQFHLTEKEEEGAYDLLCQRKP